MNLATIINARKSNQSKFEFMSGIGGGRGGGAGRSRVSAGDEELQKKLNAEAPKIAHLLKRTLGLFKPYKGLITLTISLVLISSAINVIPPLLTQQAFDVGLFPEIGKPNIQALIVILV